MKPTLKSLLPTGVLLACVALPAGAASSAASSASDSVATSVGSLSGSLVQSSNSSSKGQQVADGDYRIIEIARDESRPGMVRLKLVASDAAQPQSPAGTDEPAAFELIISQQVVVKAGLTQGATISAKQRPYGLEFAEGQPRRAFFLALRDEWYRDLQSTPVAL